MVDTKREVSFDDPLEIAGERVDSRLLLGTGGMGSLAALEGALAASGAAVSPTSSTIAPGEEIELAIDYRNVHSGQARLTVGQPVGAIWPLIWMARSDGVAALLDIREHYVSYWDANAGGPTGSDLNAIEINDRHTDRARFEREHGRVVVRVMRSGRVRELTREVPHDVQDLAGALLYLRTRTLEPGAHYEYPVFFAGDSFTLRADVQGREPMDTPAGHFATVRVAVQLGFTGRFSTPRPARLWFSDDERHVPVRIDAEFAVGSASATLSRYRPGQRLEAASAELPPTP